MKVIKRDGRHADYERNKIFIAIQKANESVDSHDRIDDDQILTLLHQSKHAAMK